MRAYTKRIDAMQKAAMGAATVCMGCGVSKRGIYIKAGGLEGKE